MRPLRFRAWNKTDKEMCSWDSDFGNADDFDGLASVIEKMQKNYTLMQYTGLGDSEGREEYFGDIIEEEDGTRRVIEDEVSVVAFRVIDGKGIKYFWDLLPNKVIGNIYENPELLEKKGE